MINWQLSKQGIRWPVSPDRIAGSGVDPSRSSIFLKLSADKLLVFKWSQAQVCFLKIYMKYVVFMSLWPSTIKILISNLPRTRKFSQLFKNTGGEDLFLPWSRVGHALGPIFMLWLVKIWQVSSCRKFMQHLENCLFPLDVQIEIQLLSRVFCLFMACLLSRFLVEKCVACQIR